MAMSTKAWTIHARLLRMMLSKYLAMGNTMIKRWLWHYNGTPMDTIHKSSAYMHEWLWQHKEAMAVLIIAIHLSREASAR